MNTSSWIVVVLLVLAASVLTRGSAAGDGDFTFAVLGDMPYNAAQEATIRTTLAPALGRAGLPFVIHLGDFKAGDESCTDEIIATRRNEIYGLLPGRVFYTPGDNEWTDCDRVDEVASPKPELERLDHLRNVFYPAPLNLAGTWDYTTQDGYPENASWTRDGLVFATIHLVSTNNGRYEIIPLDAEGNPLLGEAAKAYVKTALDRVDARDAANARWLEATFARAARIGARAVIVATQADVTKKKKYPPCSSDPTEKNCDAFVKTRAKLTELAAEFGEPVLLIHGDTNPYCLDKKFGGDQAPKLWRLNALGDFTEADATLVTVGGPGAWQAFTVNQLMTGAFLGRDADCG